MSSTAKARRSAPAQPALTAGEPPQGNFGPGAGRKIAVAAPDSARGYAPRPWAAALHRPAAKILLAGGLTLAGWLLTGALSGSTAAAAEHAACPDAPALSTVDHAATKPVLFAQHRNGRRAATKCAETPAAAPKTDETTTESTKDTQATEAPASDDPTAAPDPAASKVTTLKATTSKATTTKATSSGGLLGGLVGGVLNVVGGTLNTVTSTVGGTLSTVGAVTDTLSHTVLAPLTQPPANNPDAPALLPLDDILRPVLGGSNSGGVTATLPGLLSGTVTQVTAPAVAAAAPVAEAPAAAVTTAPQTTRVPVVHLAERQNTLPARQEQPRDSGVHARNGGGGDAPGLPSGSGAPSAPATSASAGHDGPGGARHPFAVHTDDVTTTQLKLIGASRDHDVDGAGREAALPTTSPD